VPVYKTEAIVINRINLSEADRIITFLSPTQGKFKAVARGVRRIKARMAGHLELFSRVDLMLAEGRRLDVITSARLQQYPQQLVGNFASLQKAYLLAEIVNKLLDERQPHVEVYDLLQVSLEALDQGIDAGAVELYFRLHLLDSLGYRPVLDECVICHRTPGGNLRFDPEAGGVVGSECHAGALAQSFPQVQLAVWQSALANELVPWAQLGEGAPALAVLEQFYNYLFGKQFKAAQLLG
jgi:DNA repair protein RecO (recombination protein O)